MIIRAAQGLQRPGLLDVATAAKERDPLIEGSEALVQAVKQAGGERGVMLVACSGLFKQAGGVRKLMKLMKLIEHADGVCK